MNHVVLALLCCLGATCVQAAEPSRFVAKDRLPDGQTVVVAEGDLEARAVGSYSVRLYEAAEAPNDTRVFSSGLVRPREGAVAQVLLEDVNADEQVEVVVVVRSVGTGSRRSARVFTVADGQLDVLVSVADLAPDADLLEVLREKAQVREAVRQRQADRLKK